MPNETPEAIAAKLAKLFDQYVRARNAADGRRSYRDHDAMVAQLTKADLIAARIRIILKDASHDQ